MTSDSSLSETTLSHSALGITEF